jgi:antitoxin CptB
MSEDLPQIGGLDARRRRIHFRVWRRGMHELDLLLGRFVDARIGSLSATDLGHMETLLDVPDQDLYRWIIGEEAPPLSHRSALLDNIIAFNRAS